MLVDQITLLINGVSHSLWEMYSIDSNLLTPADGWQVSLGIDRQTIPASIFEGASVQVKLGNDTVLTGLVDDIDERVAKREHVLTLSGRDYAGILTDCSAPIFTSRQIGLAEVVNQIVKPLGITKVRISGSGNFIKVAVEPGQTAWDVLQRAAEANGLWPWFEPDGTLVIGGADYSAPVVAELILNYSGIGNNVEALERRRSIAGRYSEVTVLGQSHGTESSDGAHAILGKATDETVAIYRPLTLIDTESDSPQTALLRARKLLTDGRLQGLTFNAVVYGHRITPGGLLWTPGQRIRIKSEPHGVDAIFFLMGRAFHRDRHNGTTTELMLKEDGVWTIDALPKKTKRAKVGHANDPAGEIVSLSND